MKVETLSNLLLRGLNDKTLDPEAEIVFEVWNTATDPQYVTPTTFDRRDETMDGQSVNLFDTEFF